MTQPDFATMSRKELRTYVLQNRDDAQAFRVFVDRLMAEPPRVIHPAPRSVDDLKHFPGLLKELGRDQEEI